MQPVYTEARKCERNVIFSCYPFSKSDLNDLLSCVYDIFFFLSSACFCPTHFDDKKLKCTTNVCPK